jgi:hypothetical protein
MHGAPITSAMIKHAERYPQIGCVSLMRDNDQMRKNAPLAAYYRKWTRKAAPPHLAMFVPKLVSSCPHVVQGLNVDLRELVVMRKRWLLSHCQLHGLVSFNSSLKCRRKVIDHFPHTSRTTTMQIAKFDIYNDQGKECCTAKAIMNHIRSPPLISRQAAQILSLLDYLSNISMEYAELFVVKYCLFEHCKEQGDCRS